MKIYESNKIKMNTLGKEKKEVQNKLDIIEKKFNLLADRRTSHKGKTSYSSFFKPNY